MKLASFLTAAAMMCSVAGHPAFGHFPWLVVNEDGQAELFFGETIADRNHQFPAAMADAKIRVVSNQDSVPLELSARETKDFVGLASKAQVPQDSRLQSEMTYGTYNGNRLNYYVSHINGPLPTARTKANARLRQAMMAEVVATPSGIDVYVTRDGKPLVDTQVHLYCAEGHEEAVAESDAAGKVSFSHQDVEPGLNGIMFAHTASGEGGKIGEQEYASTMHYATLTFVAPKEKKLLSTEFDELPFEVTSFGAARVGSTGFVYGGHTGSAHSYSMDEQSNQLLALDLTDPSSKWKVVTTGERLQGLALVPHDSRLVLVGGFTAKNAAGEDHDLHSQASVRAFDTKQDRWIELPSLPEGRSSHDAALIDDTIYVVGGWNMAGEEETQWHATAWSLNLAEPKPEWREIAKPPFQRRALATVAHEGKLFVIGGMDEDAGPTRKVAVYDPRTKTWSEAPSLIGQSEMAGFGAAGWSVGGKLIVSTYEGHVLRLSEDGESWQRVGKTEDSRFFHRLLPLDENHLIAVGGANMEASKFLNLEILPTGK